MKMSENEPDLEALFKAAREDGPEIPSALMARIVAEAEAARRPGPKPARASTRWGVRVGEWIGGWYGLGGLAAASAAGIWLGFAPPGGVPDAGALLWAQSAQNVDVFAGNDMVLALAEDG